MTLEQLVDEWRATAMAIAGELRDELGEQPFVGRPLPEALVRGRLPSGIASAWVFLLRARSRNPPHLHPNSIQHTAAVDGTGTVTIGDRDFALEPGELHVVPAGVAHAFSVGETPMTVLSFHTVPPDELIEIEVETGHSRGYV